MISVIWPHEAIKDIYNGIVNELVRKMHHGRKEDVFQNKDHAEDCLDDFIHEYLTDQATSCLVLFASENRNAWVDKIDVDENVDPEKPNFGPFDTMAYYALRTDVAAVLDVKDNWKLYTSE